MFDVKRGFTQHKSQVMQFSWQDGCNWLQLPRHTTDNMLDLTGLDAGSSVPQVITSSLPTTVVASAAWVT